MKCSNCGYGGIHIGADRCPECGHRLAPGISAPQSPQDVNNDMLNELRLVTSKLESLRSMEIFWTILIIISLIMSFISLFIQGSQVDRARQQIEQLKKP
jgi:hypothetical protein